MDSEADRAVVISPSIMDFTVLAWMFVVAVFASLAFHYFAHDPEPITHWLVSYGIAHFFLFGFINTLYFILHSKCLRYRIIINRIGITKEFYDGEFLSRTWDQLTRITWGFRYTSGSDAGYVVFIFDDGTRIRLFAHFLGSTPRILKAVQEIAAHDKTVQHCLADRMDEF